MNKPINLLADYKDEAGRYYHCVFKAYHAPDEKVAAASLKPEPERLHPVRNRGSLRQLHHGRAGADSEQPAGAGADADTLHRQSRISGPLPRLTYHNIPARA